MYVKEHGILDPKHHAVVVDATIDDVTPNRSQDRQVSLVKQCNEERQEVSRFIALRLDVQPVIMCIHDSLCSFS